MELTQILGWVLIIGVGIVFILFLAVVIALCSKIIKAMDDEYIKGKLNKR